MRRDCRKPSNRNKNSLGQNVVSQLYDDGIVYRLFYDDESFLTDFFYLEFRESRALSLDSGGFGKFAIESNMGAALLNYVFSELGVENTGKLLGLEVMAPDYNMPVIGESRLKKDVYDHFLYAYDNVTGENRGEMYDYLYNYLYGLLPHEPEPERNEVRTAAISSEPSIPSYVILENFAEPQIWDAVLAKVNSAEFEKYWAACNADPEETDDYFNGTSVKVNFGSFPGAVLGEAADEELGIHVCVFGNNNVTYWFNFWKNNGRDGEIYHEEQYWVEVLVPNPIYYNDGGFWLNPCGGFIERTWDGENCLPYVYDLENFTPMTYTSNRPDLVIVNEFGNIVIDKDAVMDEVYDLLDKGCWGFVTVSIDIEAPNGMHFNQPMGFDDGLQSQCGETHH